MKKKIVNVLLSAAVITTMVLSVTACGSKDSGVQDAGVSIGGADVSEQNMADAVNADNAAADDAADTDETDNADADVDNADETDADTDADADETEEADTDETDAGDVVVSSGSSSLEEWTKSDECAQFSEMMNAGLDGMKISFEVEGDTISMIFTMTDAIDVATDAEEAMNEYFTSNAEIFEAIRDQLISETGNENTVLKLVYRNADDSEIFSMEF